MCEFRKLMTLVCVTVGDMPRSRDVELTERNGRYRSRHREGTSTETYRQFADGSTDKRHRKRVKSKSIGKKKKKRSRDKSEENAPRIASSVVKPLVEYSDVSSEDLSEPEAGEIQSEDSRGGNSYTDGGDLGDSLLQRCYYAASPARNLGASPIVSSPSPTNQMGRHHRYSPLQEHPDSAAPKVMAEFDADSRRYSRRKEKKHKREKKKKQRSQSPNSSTGKKKKRKLKRSSMSPSPEGATINLDDDSSKSAVQERTWPESPAIALKDSTSPISPATPHERSDMEIESPQQQSPRSRSPRHTGSPHTPLIPPTRIVTPEKTTLPSYGAAKLSPDVAVKHVAHSPVATHAIRSSSHSVKLSPSHGLGSARRRPHSPSPPSRRRDHSPRRDYSPVPISRLRHSPSPSLRRRDIMQSSSLRSSRGETSPSTKRRRKDESSHRRRHHDKDRRDKRKSTSTRSPVGR